MGRGLLLLLLLLVGVAAAADDVEFADEPHECEPLAFTVEVPVGWEIERDRTGIVVKKGDAGFIVTRQPMFRDDRDFDDHWEKQLTEAGKDAKVRRTRAGRYVAYETDYPEGEGRTIHIWRIYVDDREMLYNIAFSLPDALDSRELVRGVVRSFRCTAEEPELRFQERPIGAGAAIEARLPEGYEKEEQRGPRMRRGASYVKRLASGHEAGRLHFTAFDARTRVQLATGRIVAATDYEALCRSAWADARGRLAEVTEEPRIRSRRMGYVKGELLAAEGIDKEGVPKRCYVLAGKVSQYVVTVSFLVDQREERLYDDLFQDIVRNVKSRKG